MTRKQLYKRPTELKTEIITQLRNRPNSINPIRKEDYNKIIENYDTDGNQ